MQTKATPDIVRSLEGVLWYRHGAPQNNRDANGVPIPVLVGKPGGGNRYATREDAKLAYKIYRTKWMKQKRLRLKLEKQTKEASK